jgi:hypothetical protein
LEVWNPKISLKKKKTNNSGLGIFFLLPLALRCASLIITIDGFFTTSLLGCYCQNFASTSQSLGAMAIN